MPEKMVVCPKAGTCEKKFCAHQVAHPKGEHCDPSKVKGYVIDRDCPVCVEVEGYDGYQLTLTE